MKWIVALCALLLCASASAQMRSLPIPEDDYLPSVAAIFSTGIRYDEKIESSSGTGFLVSNQGHLLTALHVTGEPEMYEQQQINVYFPKVDEQARWRSAGPYRATVKATLPDYDLALLQLEDTTYASLLPVLGFDFSGGLKIRTLLKGYGHSLTPRPDLVGQPGYVEGTVSRASSVSPFSEVGTSSLNIGASGGPLLGETDLRVRAMWHGAVTKFTTQTGEAVSVNGIVWVVPMNSIVQQWLVESGVTPSVTETMQPVLEDRPHGNLTIFVNTDQFKPLYGGNKSDQLYSIAAPVGTRIVTARLVQEIVKAKCVETKCKLSTSAEVNDLFVKDYRAAVLDRAFNESAKVELALRSQPRTPRIGIRYLDLNLLMGSESVEPILIQARPGKAILFAGYAPVGEAAKAKGRVMRFEGGSLSIRKQTWLMSLSGKGRLDLPARVDSMVESGQIAIVEMDQDLPLSSGDADVLRKAAIESISRSIPADAKLTVIESPTLLEAK